MNQQTLSNQKSKALLDLANRIQVWGSELGFQQTGITDLDLGAHEERYREWLANDMQGSMKYMVDQQALRLNPQQLHPGTIRIISVRMDYLPAEVETVKLLDHPEKAYISRYAMGRDYHKLIRKRLAALASRITQYIEKSDELSDLSGAQRPFVDSAPVLERAFAEKAGLGWIGKNTMLINSKAGSWFFLGELFTNIPLPLSEPQAQQHCGSCKACIDICPTKAFDREFVLDARKCISYLTIEHRGTIPHEYRKAIGNRVFGCDDCQIICPWNKFANISTEQDFKPRHQLNNINLLELFLWDEDEFLRNTEGSAIRRVGYECWLRNLAVGLGNAKKSAAIIEALKSRLSFSALVDEHIHWAIEQQKHQAITRQVL